MFLKSTARRGALMTVAGVSAIALSACGAGHISQTSSQVAAVDGASGQTEDGTVLVRDVTVIVNEDNTAALKFTAINDDTSMKEHKLQDVKVDGKPVTIESGKSLKRNCSLVADDKKNLELLTKPSNACIEYMPTTLQNSGFAAGGQKPVVFTFDSGKVEVNATIATNHNEVNTGNRVEAPKH